jgi:hypothetical protein
MRKKKRLNLLTVSLMLLAMFGGCPDCEEKLAKVCPAPVDCVIDLNEHIRTDKAAIVGAHDLGECRIGKTDCDEDQNIICVGFVTPEKEKCDNKDNNCDGMIDNGLSWDKDDDGHNSINSCLNPSDCDDTNSEVYPDRTEVCNGIDDNCDTIIDDIPPIECWTGSNDVIFSDTTPCATGIMKCSDGQLTNCEGQVLDEQERCDGLDNDCNGTIDDDPVELASLNQRICGFSAEGICAYGLEYCVEGDIKCFDAIMPQNEECNNLDDDCDGAKDENLFQPCESPCGQGMETCFQGRWRSCDAPQPQAELCDNIDNDCDGEIDEGCLCIKDDIQVCREDIYDSQGNLLNCGYGMQICDEWGMWGTCIYENIEPEICDNWDNDCDGTIDGIAAMCGNNPNLHGIGQCMMGTSICEEGQWGTCNGEVDPSEEVCDSIDNDCDGEIDEELNAHDKVDMVFIIDTSGSMCPYITALAEGIAAYVADFEDTEHRFGLIVHPSQWHTNIHGNAVVMTGLTMTNAAGLSSMLHGLGCHGGGWERTTDVIAAAVDPINPLGIPWRDDAFPYVISISDEGPQTTNSNFPYDIGVMAANCQIAGCESGDGVEIYFIDAINYLSTWLSAAYGDPSRTINIHPPSGSRYTEILKDIFQDVCF